MLFMNYTFNMKIFELAILLSIASLVSLSSALAADSDMEDAYRKAAETLKYSISDEPSCNSIEVCNTAKEYQAESKNGSFVRHLHEAIEINRARQDYYSNITSGVSKSVTRRLLFFEKISLPVARIIDNRAKEFNNKGIAIVEDDFVPMNDIPPVETLPNYKSIAGKSQVIELKESLDYLKKGIKTVLKGNLEVNNLKVICELTESTLHVIDTLESEAQAHFAMSRHVVESIGYSALHGIQYARMSDNKTLALSKFMILTQALSLKFSTDLDVKAQRCHALGAGILVNDVPHIPFEEEWNKQ